MSVASVTNMRYADKHCQWSDSGPIKMIQKLTDLLVLSHYVNISQWMSRYYHTLPGAAIVHKGHTGSVVRDYGRWCDPYIILGCTFIPFRLLAYLSCSWVCIPSTGTSHHISFIGRLYVLFLKRFKIHKFHFQHFECWRLRLILILNSFPGSG